MSVFKVPIVGTSNTNDWYSEFQPLVLLNANRRKEMKQ